MTNIDESATNDTEKEEPNPGETSAPSDYLDELAQKDNFSIYPDEDVSEVEDRFFGNNKPIGSRQRTTRKVSVFEKRRRVKLQARRVRRIVRHIEVWSVLKISILFFACLWAVFLIAGFIIWGVAESSGTVGKLESLITELFALDTFNFDGRQIFKGYALAGLILAIAGSTLNVLMVLLFNLISDLTGGLRVTMIEEETVRPSPPRRRRRITRQ
tara:strand:+ start:907 stop:1548 length:642 start_codon:yes stop_codon:yes gene_type:complete